jgi:hypothetical protein
MATTNVPVTLDTPIVVKILFRGQTKKFKLPLKDLGAQVLPAKVRRPISQPRASVSLIPSSGLATYSFNISLKLTAVSLYSFETSFR